MNSFLDSGESKLPSMLGNSTISPSSSDSGPSDCDTNNDEDEEEEEDDEDDDVEVKWTMAAALVAAAWTSWGLRDAGRGNNSASSGKFRMAELPLMLRAATSCARAAISGVENVPSQMRDFLRGSRISDTHLPQLRIRTPR